MMFSTILKKGRLLFILLLAVSLKSSAQKLTSSNKDIEAAFNLAVKTVNGNIKDGILAAGGDYGSEWTRDIAINSWNSGSLLIPDVAEKSLWSVTINKDSIGHQYWDKIIWVIAALNHYNDNGDKNFLTQAYICSANTIKDLEDSQLDKGYGLFMGPSVFNDGISGYPAPIFDSTNMSTFVLDHKNSHTIKCLSTNCVYYQAYKTLAIMARLNGDGEKAAEHYEQKAAGLRENILRYFYNKKSNTFNYVIDNTGKIHTYQEGLGYSFAVMFGIIKGEEANSLIKNAYESKFGIPSIYPDFARYSPQMPGRHNDIIWPMVNGFYAKAAIVSGNYTRFSNELNGLTHLAIDTDKGNGDFREVYNPYTGKPYGGWQANKLTYSCKRQTWSATAYINMVLYGVMGMRFNNANALSFKPYLPANVSNISIDDVKYREATLDITVEGKGKMVKAFMLNGVKLKSNSVSSKLKGKIRLGL